jgi:hypothetical protein
LSAGFQRRRNKRFIENAARTFIDEKETIARIDRLTIVPFLAQDEGEKADLRAIASINKA